MTKETMKRYSTFVEHAHRACCEVDNGKRSGRMSRSTITNRRQGEQLSKLRPDGVHVGRVVIIGIPKASTPLVVGGTLYIGSRW